MTTKEYLEKYKKYPSSENKYEGWEKDLEDIKQFNKNLIEKYLWLKPYNRWTGKTSEDYDYEFTELDEMPEGWRLAFGDQMVEEIHQQLVRYDFVNDYKIVQIKEKWGGLRWYDGGTPIGKLSDEYEEIDWKPSEHEGKWNPSYDRETEFLKEVGVEHYISYFDRKNSSLSDKEIEEYNRNAIHHYKIYKIVEKCRIPDIISKYENLSFKICINCGKPANWLTTGWISPYCDDCKKAMMETDYFNENSFERLKEDNI